MIIMVACNIIANPSASANHLDHNPAQIGFIGSTQDAIDPTGMIRVIFLSVGIAGKETTGEINVVECQPPAVRALRFRRTGGADSIRVARVGGDFGAADRAGLRFCHEMQYSIPAILLRLLYHYSSIFSIEVPVSNTIQYFDITPRIVRAGSPAVVTVRPLFDHVRFNGSEPVQVALIPLEGTAGMMRWEGWPRRKIQPEGGVLRIACEFGGEQEYLLVIEREGKTLAEFRLFALEADLFARRPFKGDFHMHTHHSDGVESPAYVAAACRKIGIDFMAITDHARYFPSLEAIQAFDGVQTDLRIYPGEEVHPPENPVHMLNFGGSFSINELFRQERYRGEVQAIADRLTGFPEGMERYQYASCVWCFEQIRAAGGLGVFCHPYWYSRQRYDVPVALTDQLFERQPYAALELIGGYHRFEIESNTLQVARYQEERARGKRIPIVGVSDSHGCETGALFGWYYTVAFAPSSDLPDLVGSIQDLYSVAVEALPGETARAYGPFRLVRYAQFLMREVFPAHDDLCREEGRLLLAHAAGDPRAAAALAGLKGRVGQLYDHWWG
jgi:hypothetical protein